MDGRCPRWLPLLLIVAAGFGVRLAVALRAEAAARDSIGTVRTALRFDREPFRHVVQTTDQNPGYALAVWATHGVVRRVAGRVDCGTLTLSAQLVSVLFGALAAVPVAGLGRELFGRTAGLTAAALLQCLPVWVKITADGLSEGAFLFWVALACWLGVRALRTGGVARAGLCGLASGVAYWTRPEGAEVAVAFGAVIVLIPWLARRPWRPAVTQGAALGVGLACLVGLYVGVNGRLTNKNTARYMLGDADVDRTGIWTAPSSAPTREPLGVFWADGDRSKFGWAAKSLVKELAQGFNYAVGALAVLGSFVAFRRTTNPAGLWAMVALAGLHTALLGKMMVGIGYLSERHTLFLIVAGLLPAAIALVMIVERFAPAGRSGVVLVAALLGLFALGVPSLLKPLHANRAGHRAAGEWLLTHAAPDAGIIDPFGWAHYYAGREFGPPEPPVPAEVFVVLETSDNQHSRLPLIPEAKAKAAMGEDVYWWPAGDRSQASVVVSRVPWGSAGRK